MLDVELLVTATTFKAMELLVIIIIDMELMVITFFKSSGACGDYDL